MDGSDGRQYPRHEGDAGGTIVGRRVELAALEARLDHLAGGAEGLIVELAGARVRLLRFGPAALREMHPADHDV